ncbi:hypothetical protein [Dyella sp.]|uniref:hypothetical protein n=1 Tax=Dyella sp. TaxID=1869338 RepID=UPI002ED574A2
MALGHARCGLGLGDHARAVLNGVHCLALGNGLGTVVRLPAYVIESLCLWMAVGEALQLSDLAACRGGDRDSHSIGRGNLVLCLAW